MNVSFADNLRSTQTVVGQGLINLIAGATEFDRDDVSFTSNRYNMDGQVDSDDQNRPHCCL